MAETTYAVTYHHTSPYITFDDPTHDNFWYVDCPMENGRIVCVDDSGNVQGSHYHNATVSSIAFNFWGKSIYLYGDTDPGMALNISINHVPLTITPSPANGILAAIDDWTLYCNGTCRSSEYPSGFTRNYLQLSATQSVAGAKVYLTKAVFQTPTGRSNTTTLVKTYLNDDRALDYSRGWFSNGTYMQSGPWNDTSASDSQTLKLAFDGVAIWVWQFCGYRAEYEDDWYGKLTVDGDAWASPKMSPTRFHRSIQDPKCLAYFWGGLNNTRHDFLLDSVHGVVQFHSIDVLQITGGTNITSGSTLAFINPFGRRKGALNAAMAVTHLLVACLIATLATL